MKDNALPAEPSCEIVLLFCRNCMTNPSDVDVAAQKASGCKIRPVMMPCSSKIEVPNLLKILERGADAVLVVACPEDCCRYLTGSKRAEKRINYARALLEQIRMSPDRLVIKRKSGLLPDGLTRLAVEYAKVVGPLGPSHMKKGEYK